MAQGSVQQLGATKTQLERFSRLSIAKQVKAGAVKIQRRLFRELVTFFYRSVCFQYNTMIRIARSCRINSFACSF